MKSLKIEDNKIVIKDKEKIKINEVTGITDDVAKVGSGTVDAVKNISKTAAALSKFVLKMTLSPVIYYTVKKFNGTTPSFKEWISNASKNLKDLSKDVDDITRSFDNDFKKMLPAIGLSEKEMNVVLFAGSPPLAILNTFYNAMDRQKSPVNASRNLKNYENIIEKVVYIITIVATGKEPVENKSAKSFMQTIRTEVKNYFGNIFGSNAKKILDSLHNNDYWKTHSAAITTELSPLLKEINFKSAFNDPVNTFDKLAKSVNESILNDVIKKTKAYCDTNIDKRLVDSFVRQLNLKTNIISEVTPQGGNKLDAKSLAINKLSFAYAFIVYKKNEEKIQNYAVKTMSANKVDIKKILSCLNSKKNIITHLTAIYANYIISETYCQAVEKILSDENLEKSDLDKLLESIKIKSLENIPNDYKRGISTELNLDLENDRINLVNFKNLINEQLKSSKVNLFDFSAYKDGALLRKLGDSNLFDNEDKKFIDAIFTEAGFRNIETRLQQTLNEVKDAESNTQKQSQSKQT